MTVRDGSCSALSLAVARLSRTASRASAYTDMPGSSRQPWTRRGSGTTTPSFASSTCNLSCRSRIMGIMGAAEGEAGKRKETWVPCYLAAVRRSPNGFSIGCFCCLSVFVYGRLALGRKMHVTMWLTDTVRSQNPRIPSFTSTTRFGRSSCISATGFQSHRQPSYNRCFAN